MSSRLQKHKDLLKVLVKSNSKLAKSILKEVDNGFIVCMCEIVKNVLQGNLKVSNSLKNKLGKHKLTLRKLASRGVDVKQKRRLMQKGGFLPLLPMLASAVGGLLFGNH